MGMYVICMISHDLCKYVSQDQTNENTRFVDKNAAWCADKKARCFNKNVRCVDKDVAQNVTCYAQVVYHEVVVYQ